MRRSGPSRRKTSHRPLKTTVLLVCEGKETERNYFDQLKREDAICKRFAITVKRGKGGSPEAVAKHAVQSKDNSNTEYDEVWCVMDVEDANQRASLDKALTILRENDIKACLSNPAFEVWLLSHFERTARIFNDCGAVIAQLDKCWQREFSTSYNKSDGAIYRLVSDQTNAAIENAMSVREKHHGMDKPAADCNSCTEVYRLVKRLLDG